MTKLLQIVITKEGDLIKVAEMGIGDGLKGVTLNTELFDDEVEARDWITFKLNSLEAP